MTPAETGARSALIVATYLYDDPGLTRLHAPERDAEELALVLSDPNIGGFDVKTVTNAPWHQVNLAVAEFFHGRRPDDLLLLHFSCHGLKDDSGELYFAATDTRLDLLEATGVPSSFVSRSMDRSRAGRVLLLLDCCYAGAFARGLVPRAAGTVDVGDRLGGRGRAVITASSALQFAFEGDRLADGDLSAATPSAFTSALVRGLSTGDADRDLDGWVSLDELYAYVHDEVTRISPDQTPKKWAFDIEGDVYVARRGSPVTRPAELPDEVETSMHSLVAWEREASVLPLRALLLSGHPGRSLAARLALSEMADHDDSDRVKATARAALVEAAAALPPQPPERASGPQQPALPVLRTPPTEQQPPDAQPPDAQPPRRIRPRRRLSDWRRLLVGAGCVVGVVLTILLVIGLLLPKKPPADNPLSGGDLTTLPDTEVLLTVQRDGDPRQLVAYDTAADTGNTRPVLDDPKALLPVISPDRRSFAYLEASGARQRLMVASADGSGIHAVLDDSESSRCPVANRPAWSPDGRRLAVVCLPKKNAASSGLYVVNRDGTDPKLVTSDDDPEGAPTWSGPDTIVFQSGNDRVPPPSSLWEVSADGGQPKRYGASHFPKSASRPDWSSENGVLFLLTDPGTNAGRVMYEKSRGVASDLAQQTDAQFPAWGPDGTQSVWLSSHGAGFTLWYSSGPGATPRALKIDGSNATFGAPAWGSR